ncbi:hypothetical protein DITRI_Ditri04bG0113800 [Diplodiscus trichospermus]
MNTIMSMVWGGKVRGEKGAKTEGHFKEIYAELMVLLRKPNLSDIFAVLVWLDIQGIGRGMKKIIHSFDQLLDSVIELRTKAVTEKEVDGESEKKLDFLQMLLELQVNEDSTSLITMNQLKGYCGGWNRYDINYSGVDNGRTNTTPRNNGKSEEKIS